MYSFKFYFLIFLPILLCACSSGKNSRYKDTSHLELPPKMEIVEKPKKIVEENELEKNKGLGKQVKLSGSADKPIIKVKKMFDRSWELVEQSLKMSEIEVTDKNRDKGVYYVKFDPDSEQSEDTEFLDSLTFHIFKDKYDESAYKISVKWIESDTEISAELANGSNNNNLLDNLDDDEDIDEGSEDAGGLLIKKLYKVIRDDLPLN